MKKEGDSGRGIGEGDGGRGIGEDGKLVVNCSQLSGIRKWVTEATLGRGKESIIISLEELKKADIFFYSVSEFV